jgi:TM2 domain-containing membrane protein YozV
MEKKYISALLSGLVFPGAGQFYNSQRMKGIVYILLTLFSLVALVSVIMRGFYRALEYAYSTGGELWDAVGREVGTSRGAIVILILVLVVSWAGGIVDAYLVARDRERRIKTRIISRKGR